MKGGSGWRNLPAPLRRRLRLAVFVRDRYVCQLRLPGCTTDATQADHIRPAHLYGHGLDNLQAACASCNRKKGEPEELTDPKSLPGAWG